MSSSLSVLFVTSSSPTFPTSPSVPNRSSQPDGNPSGGEVGSPATRLPETGLTTTYLTVAYDRVVCLPSWWHTVCMSKRKIKAVWSDTDRQAFSDGFRLRSARFIDRRKQTAKDFCRQQQERYRRSLGE
jgi:hypothetical protein